MFLIFGINYLFQQLKHIKKNKNIIQFNIDAFNNKYLHFANFQEIFAFLGTLNTRETSGIVNLSEALNTIAGPNANKVKALNLNEDVTGIEIVQELEQEDNTMYDLQGRVIKNPQLGHLYIMQGKKCLNKK